MRQQTTAKPVFTRDILERLHAPAPPQIRAFLAEPYPVDPTKIDEYREKGYVKLKGIITGEPLEYYCELIGLAVGHRFKDDQRALSEKRVYEQSFLQAFNLWPHYPAIAEFVQSIRFADVARRMMRVEGVKLWFDQALYKEPGGRITDYHVDAAFWPVQPAAKTTTIWMALVDVPREKGCMAFAKGSHKLSPDAEFVDIFNAQEEIAIGDNVRHYPWEWAQLAQGDCTFHSGCMQMVRGSHKLGLLDHDEDGLFHGNCQESYLWEDGSRVANIMPKTGGISIHHALTLHGSPANISGKPRRGVVFQYRADDAYQLAQSVWADTGLLMCGQRRERARCDAGVLRLPKSHFFPGYPFGDAWNQDGELA